MKHKSRKRPSKGKRPAKSGRQSIKFQQKKTKGPQRSFRGGKVI